MAPQLSPDGERGGQTPRCRYFASVGDTAGAAAAAMGSSTDGIRSSSSSIRGFAAATHRVSACLSSFGVDETKAHAAARPQRKSSPACSREPSLPQQVSVHHVILLLHLLVDVVLQRPCGNDCASTDLDPLNLTRTNQFVQLAPPNRKALRGSSHVVTKLVHQNSLKSVRHC